MVAGRWEKGLYESACGPWRQRRACSQRRFAAAGTRCSAQLAPRCLYELVSNASHPVRMWGAPVLPRSCLPDERRPGYPGRGRQRRIYGRNEYIMTRQGPSEKRRAVGTAARLPSAIAAQARTVAGPSQISTPQPWSPLLRPSTSELQATLLRAASNPARGLGPLTPALLALAAAAVYAWRLAPGGEFPDRAINLLC